MICKITLIKKDEILNFNCDSICFDCNMIVFTFENEKFFIYEDIDVDNIELCFYEICDIIKNEIYNNSFFENVGYGIIVIDVSNGVKITRGK